VYVRSVAELFVFCSQLLVRSHLEHGWCPQQFRNSLYLWLSVLRVRDLITFTPDEKRFSELVGNIVAWSRSVSAWPCPVKTVCSKKKTEMCGPVFLLDADSGDVSTEKARPRTLLAQRSGSSYYPASLSQVDEDSEDADYSLPPMKIALAVDAGAGGGVASSSDEKGIQSGAGGAARSGNSWQNGERDTAPQLDELECKQAQYKDDKPINKTISRELIRKSVTANGDGEESG
jgi:hypothetical protein